MSASALLLQLCKKPCPATLPNLDLYMCLLESDLRYSAFSWHTLCLGVGRASGERIITSGVTMKHLLIRSKAFTKQPREIDV
jgi:hypothetical protein